MTEEERANAARIYDYMLGGAHNLGADREAARTLLASFPWLQRVAWENRAFLRRAVEFCVGEGVEQFLDLGSGVPTVGNVHEIAPGTRVAYVDIEPVAVQGARDLLAGVPDVTATRADLRRPADVLAAEGVAGLLDFGRPVAVLLVAALHFVAPDDDVATVLAAYRAALVPGSLLVVSHGSADQDDPEIAEAMRTITAVMAASETPAYSRSRAEITRLFADDPGLELLPPALVDVAAWPEPDDRRAPVGVYAAVARVV
ncbi:SAM-dependent methyltransferase [Actinomycetospora succinea]|uniref:SAM-dependent methyltransferase n=1 Tax=Actinomycetospora succinea TaxID=663603 RepID=UPI00105BABEA|nr:SAM-dependent methyltransferase [Actinomycetospora succinea]